MYRAKQKLVTARETTQNNERYRNNKQREDWYDIDMISILPCHSPCISRLSCCCWSRRCRTATPTVQHRLFIYTVKLHAPRQRGWGLQISLLYDQLSFQHRHWVLRRGGKSWDLWGTNANESIYVARGTGRQHRIWCWFNLRSPFSSGPPAQPDPRCHIPRKVNSVKNITDLHNHMNFQEHATFEALTAVLQRSQVFREAVSLGKWFQTFRRYQCFQIQGSSSLRGPFCLGNTIQRHGITYQKTI
jgi:hypothetical protein